MILAAFFPLAAAMNFGYLFLLLLQRLLLLLLVPGWKNTTEKITSRQGNNMEAVRQVIEIEMIGTAAQRADRCHELMIKIYGTSVSCHFNSCAGTIGVC